MSPYLPLTDPLVVARYRALLDHCSACIACRADPTTACPQAQQLRRTWSRSRRGAAS